MKKSFKLTVTKFCKRTTCLVLAALVLIPAISYSMPNGFKSAKALSSYETVGVGKKLVDCFPGEDRLFAQYVYEKILGKSCWFSEVMEYKLVDDDVKAIQNCKTIDMRRSAFVSDRYRCSDITGIQNFINLTSLNVSHNKLSFLPELPAGLTYLNISENQFTSLPDLPTGLLYLNVSGNYLDFLPDDLPAGLVVLNVSGNKLKSLPKLPASITNLNISSNQFTIKPSNLPDGITCLCI